MSSPETSLLELVQSNVRKSLFEKVDPDVQPGGCFYALPLRGLGHWAETEGLSLHEDLVSGGWASLCQPSSPEVFWSLLTAEKSDRFGLWALFELLAVLDDQKPAATGRLFRLMNKSDRFGKLIDEPKLAFIYAALRGAFTATSIAMRALGHRWDSLDGDGDDPHYPLAVAGAKDSLTFRVITRLTDEDVRQGRSNDFIRFKEKLLEIGDNDRASLKVEAAHGRFAPILNGLLYTLQRPSGPAVNQASKTTAKVAGADSAPPAGRPAWLERPLPTAAMQPAAQDGFGRTQKGNWLQRLTTKDLSVGLRAQDLVVKPRGPGQSNGVLPPFVCLVAALGAQKFLRQHAKGAMSKTDNPNDDIHSTRAGGPLPDRSPTVSWDELIKLLRSRNNFGQIGHRLAGQAQTAAPTLDNAEFSVEDGTFQVLWRWPHETGFGNGPLCDMMPAMLQVWRHGQADNAEWIPATAFNPTELESNLVCYTVEPRPAPQSMLFDLLEGVIDPEHPLYPGNRAQVLNLGDSEHPRLVMALGIALPP